MRCVELAILEMVMYGSEKKRDESRLCRQYNSHIVLWDFFAALNLIVTSSF